VSESKNKETRELALEFSNKHEFDYFKVVGRAVFWNPAEHKTEYLHGDHEYHNLHVKATASRSMTGQPSYGWRVEYGDVCTVDEREAEQMLKALRRINRGVDKLRDQFGSPATFGAYVLRVAKAMGVKRLVFPSVHEENEVRTLIPQSAQEVLDEWIAAYHAGQEERVA
jgi:hypothetical protein